MIDFLLTAIDEGNLEQVDQFMQAGANLNEKNEKGETFLSVLVNLMPVERETVCDKLLEYYNQMNEDFRTHLFLYLASTNHTKQIETMLSLGMNVNSSHSQRKTALMIAAENGNTKTVKVLMHHGADSSLSSIEGKTAMDYAREHTHQRTLDCLKNTPT